MSNDEWRPAMNEKIKIKTNEIRNSKIFEKYKKLKCINILNVNEREEIDSKIIGAFDEIHKIEYPKSFSTQELNEPYKYIEYLYEKTGLKEECLRWLIPRFDGGNKWYEIIVFNLQEFFDIYFEDRIFEDFSAADLNNDMVFNIENGEYDIDFYIKELLIK